MSRDRSWPRVPVAALALALACGYELHRDHLGSEGCPAGAEGCPCAEDDACDGALSCVAGSCQAGGAGSSTGEAAAPSSDGCAFLCEVDLPEQPWACDLYRQDCEAGLKCAAHDRSGDGDYDSTRCVPVVGGGQHGQPCVAEGIKTGLDDCARGVLCYGVDPQGRGECVELCTGSAQQPECGPPFHTCLIVGGGFLNLCRNTCHPLAQNCPAGGTCVGDPEDGRFRCMLDTSGGLAPAGAPCQFDSSCNPGHTCVAPAAYPDPSCADAAGCCAPYCDLEGGGEGCEELAIAIEGLACAPYHEPDAAPFGYDDVGVCVVAP